MRHLLGLVMAILAAGGVTYFYPYLENWAANHAKLPFWFDDVAPVILTGFVVYMIALYFSRQRTRRR